MGGSSQFESTPEVNDKQTFGSRMHKRRRFHFLPLAKSITITENEIWRNSKGTHAHLLVSDFQLSRAFALTNSVDPKQAVENFPF